jgi:hypothetical protein
VGPDGEVTGTDVDEAMLAAAGELVTTAEGLPNVTLARDDLFATRLEPIVALQSPGAGAGAGAAAADRADQFASALEERLPLLASPDELERLRGEGEAQLRDPGRWRTTFTLLQVWGTVPG